MSVNFKFQIKINVKIKIPNDFETKAEPKRSEETFHVPINYYNRNERQKKKIFTDSAESTVASLHTTTTTTRNPQIQDLQKLHHQLHSVLPQTKMMMTATMTEAARMTTTSSHSNSREFSKPSKAPSFFSTHSFSSKKSSSPTSLFGVRRHRRKLLNHHSVFVSIVAIIFLFSLQIDLIRGAFEDVNNNKVKVTTRSLELTQTINMQRQEYMQKECDTLGYNQQDLDDLTEDQMDHMIVDKELKFLYCYVPKVS